MPVTNAEDGVSMAKGSYLHCASISLPCCNEVVQPTRSVSLDKIDKLKPV